MTTWTKEDEQRLRENEYKLSQLVVQESRLEESIREMQQRKEAFDLQLLSPLREYITANWIGLSQTNRPENVDKVVKWLRDNRTVVVSMLNKIDEVMK